MFSLRRDVMLFGNNGGSLCSMIFFAVGYPTPRIQWLQGDTVLATLSAGEHSAPTRSLTLVIRNATRAHLGALYTCTADNTLLALPQKTTVKVDLFCKYNNHLFLLLYCFLYHSKKGLINLQKNNEGPYQFQTRLLYVLHITLVQKSYCK